MYTMLNSKRYRTTKNPANPESFWCGLGTWLWGEWEVVSDKLHPTALKLSPLEPEVPVFSDPFFEKIYLFVSFSSKERARVPQNCDYPPLWCWIAWLECQKWIFDFHLKWKISLAAKFPLQKLTDTFSVKTTKLDARMCLHCWRIGPRI